MCSIYGLNLTVFEANSSFDNSNYSSLPCNNILSDHRLVIMQCHARRYDGAENIYYYNIALKPGFYYI